MKDGSLVVCERSLKKNTRNGPSIPPVHHFVRVEMLSGSYLIRPCGGGFFLILNRWGIGSLLASQGSKIMDTMHGHPLMHHPKGQVFVCFFFNSSSFNVKYLIFIKIPFPNNFLKFQFSNLFFFYKLHSRIIFQNSNFQIYLFNNNNNYCYFIFIFYSIIYLFIILIPFSNNPSKFQFLNLIFKILIFK